MTTTPAEVVDLPTRVKVVDGEPPAPGFNVVVYAIVPPIFNCTSVVLVVFAKLPVITTIKGLPLDVGDHVQLVISTAEAPVQLILPLLEGADRLKNDCEASAAKAVVVMHGLVKSKCPHVNFGPAPFQLLSSMPPLTILDMALKFALTAAGSAT